MQLFGPRLYSPADVAKALEDASGSQIQLEIISKNNLASYFQKHIPEKYVASYVEMVDAILPGGIISSDVYANRGGNIVYGELELVDYFKELI